MARDRFEFQTAEGNLGEVVSTIATITVGSLAIERGSSDQEVADIERRSAEFAAGLLTTTLERMELLAPSLDEVEFYTTMSGVLAELMPERYTGVKS